MKGTVKWFNNQKGYGFISDESGKDETNHYTKEIVYIMVIECNNLNITEGAKGPQAVNVTKL